MKTLVTGVHGFVGARIVSSLKDCVPAPSLRNMDEKAVRKLVDEVQPDLIIHTAAMADISSCEKDPEGSWQANVLLPLYLARTGVKLVAFSTDQVYSGCSGEESYSEEVASPANLYAQHKLEMERRTLEINPDTVLLRATWMYDMPMYGVPNRSNFLVMMLKGGNLSFSATQHRGLTYVREVAGWIGKAAGLPGGVYNYGSENVLTALETAEWLKKELSLPVRLQDAGPAHHLWMDCKKARQHGIYFGSTLDGLTQCIRDYAL